MPRNEENIIEGTIPVVINFDNVVMGKASSRRLKNGDIELVVCLRKEHADDILGLIKDEYYVPVALSFAYISAKPEQIKE